MHFVIVLIFSVLLRASVAGGTMTSNQSSKSSGSKRADETHSLGSAVHDTYEGMSNHKLWRELIKKRNLLETGQRQWQHLLNLRQEKMNKLSGKPLRHNIPSKGIPDEIIRKIEEILVYKPVDYKFYESEGGLEDKNEASYSRNSHGLNKSWGSGISRQTYEGSLPSQHNTVDTSLYQKLTPQTHSLSNVSPPVEVRNNVQPKISNQTKESEKLTRQVQFEVYPPGEERTDVQTRVSHKTQQTSFGQPRKGVNPPVHIEASAHHDKGGVFPPVKQHFQSDDKFPDTPLVIY